MIYSFDFIMFIMIYNDYEAVKLVTAARPNLGFYSSTPLAPPCAKAQRGPTPS